MTREYSKRVQIWMNVLKDMLYEPLGEISLEAYRTMRQLSYETALAGDYTPVSSGFTWGKEWEYCWFKGSITLPKEAEGQRIVMALEPGGESTIFVNGQSFGTYRSDRCNTIFEKYHFYMDNILSSCAKAGETFEIVMETFAGHDYPHPMPGCCYGPVVDGGYEYRQTDGQRRTLGTCSYGIWNEEAYQLYMDVRTLELLWEELDKTSLRAMKIEAALEQFTILVDFEESREKRQESYCRAREMLRPLMEAENGSTMPEFYAIGNAHIDLAWLWPLSETVRKTARTFAAQLRLLQEYPEYRFVQSQPALYEMCRKAYPELFERIKEAVREGRWIAEGGMWVEPDTNMAGGEALIRQLLYGKAYYKQEFDIDSEILWLPDTFGYTAALPQILQGCGIKYLVTQKIFWSYDGKEQFPYHYFNWTGMDGSTVTSFLPTSYTYRTNPSEVNRTWKNRSQARDLDAFLLPYGYGDGGGGPCRDHIEFALRQKNLEGSVRMKLAGPKEFFEDMDRKGGPKNTWVGELYFSAHRGTYTTQALMKKNNRKAEIRMRELELWATVASLSDTGFVYPKTKAEELWKVVLLHQFHDILPGSCIAKVYEEAEQTFRQFFEETDLLIGEAAGTLLTADEEAVTVFNSLSFERKVLISLPECFKEGALLCDGSYVSTECSEGQVRGIVTLPPCGMISLMPAKEKRTDKPADTEYPQAVIIQSGEDFILENPYVRAAVNDKGEVYSYVLKESGREFAAEPMNRFHIYKDTPRVFDAWDIDSNYRLQEMDGVSDVEVTVISRGMEAVLCVTGHIHESSYTQYIRLGAVSRRLEFDTQMDWREVHKLLKVSFPVDVFAENAFHEMQFGYVERPTHRSGNYDQDRFEVCNHRYTALCDGAHGGAVLNDCKYGISVNGNVMELTLLRAAVSPAFRTDNGVHHFTYGFTAWEGEFADCDVVRQAYELNVRPFTVQGKGSDGSFLSIGAPNVFLESMKQAEDGSGDVILRLYEAKKAAGNVTLHFACGDLRAYICDMLENVTEEIPVHDGEVTLPFRAFEIRTLRLKREE